jgi:endoglucanase
MRTSAISTIAAALAALCLTAALSSQPAPQPVPEIKVDQVGYLPNADKLAMIVSSRPASRFDVRQAEDNAVVLTGELSPPVEDPDSGDLVKVADFSSLRSTGRFYLDVPDVGRSWPFEIGADVYARAWHLAMRAFYGQRCNTDVDLAPDAPGYSHGVCHREGAYHPTSGRTGARRMSGGWHDAGDYGRYVVNSGISTGTLLWMWELSTDRVKSARLSIPESGNDIPDVLDEIRWNLDWMLSMQDGDGGVWHKQTSERFSGFVMPEKDTLISYVVGTGAPPHTSTCATADLAAVMAVAARVYRPFDAAFSVRARVAAQSAWAWTEKHPDVRFTNPTGIVTGEYGDSRCDDERLWAAAELWRTTGERRYHRYVQTNAQAHRATIRPIGPPSWQSVAPLGLWTYALVQNGGRTRADAALQASLRRDIVEAAQAVVDRSRRHPYRISMTTTDFVWGSNGVAANYGVQLLVAQAIEPREAFLAAARENLHYLLGRNTFSLSWVTGLGANPYRYPHHRPSGADDQIAPWPGLLAGGPNRQRQDPAMQKLPDLPPARMYLDEEASYATNEIAINWNAPLVFLLACVQP